MASPNRTYITPGSGTITDAAGNVFSISNDSSRTAIENGTAMAGGGGTGEIEYYNDTIYGQDYTSGTWHTWKGSYWSTAAAPPAPTAVTTFHDEFTSLSLHRTWQAGDKWQLIAPGSPDGRGGPYWGESGSQWWVNPYNPNTPINGVYKDSNGILQLGILPTPAAYQAYIDQQAGTNLPYVGALLNTSTTNYQHYGYYELRAAVPRDPGFTFQADIENVQLTGHWPPEIDFDVYTDSSGVQYVKFDVATRSGYLSYTTSSSNGFDARSYHTYGWNWQFGDITFYIDGKQVWQTPNPGGVYTTDKQFLYLVTYANHPSGVINPATLPAYAHVDYVRIYQNRPLATDPPPSVSTNDTVVTTGTGGSIVDARGNTWSIANGQVVVNGSVDTTTSNVIELAYVGGRVWQENASKLWWEKTLPTDTWAPAAGTAKPPVAISVTDTATNATSIIDATDARTLSQSDATFALTAPGVASVTLGSTATSLSFMSMISVAVADGSAASTIKLDGGLGSFTAGKGTMDVTGGPGKDAYVFHTGDAALTVEDFSVSGGDTLTIDTALKAGLMSASDGHNGTILSFGTGTGKIDLKDVANFQISNIHWA